MKKILLFLVSLFAFPLSIFADHIYKVDMNIDIQKDGSANIVETWDVEADSGTEWYKQLYNMGNSEISNFKVSMDGNALEEKDWDVNETLSEKSGYYGINYVSKGIELCFGKGDMDRHQFILSYTLSNFIINTEDAQVLYWTLLPKASMDNFYVKVTSYYQFSQSLDVWGYGYKGYAYVYDGYIEMSSEGTLSNEYVVLLAKFPLNTFETTNTVSNYNKFDDVYTAAKKGSYKHNYNNNDWLAILGGILSIVVNIVVWGVLIVLFSKASKKGGNYRYGKTGNKVRKDVPNFREIPCNKDIMRAYFVAEKYNLNNKKTDLLGAILLKWLKNGNVRVEKVDKKGIFKNKVEDNIIFINPPTDIELESKLYDWMLTASKDGKLESGEFKKWCSNNYSKILKWFDDVIDYERDLLIAEGKITVSEEVKAKIFRNTYYDVDSSMMIEAEQMKGLKNYLREFTLIKEKEPIEVALWDEYLIYAQIFGMADEVAKQFKKLYPEITEQMNNLGYDYNDIVFMYNISNSGISSANTARSRAESYSSGGGGFSSGGGGGGSFGGGGSMGGR